MKRALIAYSILMAVLYILLLFFNIRYRRGANNYQMAKTLNDTQLVITLVCIIVVTVLIGRAFYRIHHTSQLTENIQTQLNNKMLFTNIAFYMAFFASNICYLYQSEDAKRFALISFLYELCRCCVEAIIMYLTSLFHANIHVKSAVTQNGELLITGVDEKGKDLFNFFLRAENVAKDMNDDDSSDSDSNNLNCSVLDQTQPEMLRLSGTSGMSSITLQAMQKKMVQKNASFFLIAAQMIQNVGSDLVQTPESSKRSLRTSDGFEGVLMRYNERERTKVAKTEYIAPHVN